MAAINAGKVLVGGLAAGVVMNVIDWASNMFIMGDRMKADMDRLDPMLWENMNRGSTIAGFVLVDFILGILLVWLYAAIRPRYGAGPGTAVKAGVYFWAVGGSIWFTLTLTGIVSGSAFIVGAVVALVNFLVSAWVGAMLYTEEA